MKKEKKMFGVILKDKLDKRGFDNLTSLKTDGSIEKNKIKNLRKLN
jgi:hypothetical protein